MPDPVTAILTPRRVQRRRTAGWRKPDGAVIVDRTSRWGNPFTIGWPGITDRASAIAAYRDWLHGAGSQVYHRAVALDREWVLQHLQELAGRDLCCPCPEGEPCHGDVLLRLANSAADSDRRNP